MRQKLENDLKQALLLIDSNWSMQNNFYDKRTNFIYSCETLSECLSKIDSLGVDKNYALHRWYNYKTSVEVEYIFCDYGAVHETDKYNHDVDIFIENIPFDVKLTVYPKALSSRPYDLNSRDGKNDMIRWFYEHQSQEGRKQILNRLYVVCDGETQNKMIKKKCEFSTIEVKIKDFMNEIKLNGINQLEIFDNGKNYRVFSDIVVV